MILNHMKLSLVGFIFERYTHMHVTPAIAAMADMVKLPEVTTCCLYHNFSHFVSNCPLNNELSVHNSISHEYCTRLRAAISFINKFVQMTYRPFGISVFPLVHTEFVHTGINRLHMCESCPLYVFE